VSSSAVNLCFERLPSAAGWVDSREDISKCNGKPLKLFEIWTFRYLGSFSDQSRIRLSRVKGVSRMLLCRPELNDHHEGRYKLSEIKAFSWASVVAERDIFWTLRAESCPPHIFPEWWFLTKCKYFWGIKQNLSFVSFRNRFGKRSKRHRMLQSELILVDLWAISNREKDPTCRTTRKSRFSCQLSEEIVRIALLSQFLPHSLFQWITDSIRAIVESLPSHCACVLKEKQKLRWTRG
jgi:hypothetical protein